MVPAAAGTSTKFGGESTASCLAIESRPDTPPNVRRWRKSNFQEPGKRVAVLGAGPAGLACAHRLAMKGHGVTVYEAKAKPGGLNEFGIAAYKTVEGFAAREVDWLLQIGGIEIEYGRALGRDLTLDALREDFDAVFLGVGLGGTNLLGVDGADRDGVDDAVRFIEDLRQAGDLAALPIGRNVVVIGGGMTAVDAAVQSKLLGAESVTIAYRRGRDRMPASRYEQDLAASKGVRILTHVMPKAVHGNGAAQEIELDYAEERDGRLQATGETIRLQADQVFTAIGQTLTLGAGLETEGGKIAVTGPGRTSLPGVWAGGGCPPGEGLPVVAGGAGRGGQAARRRGRSGQKLELQAFVGAGEAEHRLGRLLGEGGGGRVQPLGQAVRGAARLRLGPAGAAQRLGRPAPCIRRAARIAAQKQNLAHVALPSPAGRHGLPRPRPTIVTPHSHRSSLTFSWPRDGLAESVAEKRRAGRR